jgi:hypothetical protein
MIKFAARAGILGPLLFGGVVTTLTILKYDFLLSLGWHPLYAPTFDWPSGLALGKYGWIMTATFILSGFMLTLFASGLCLNLPRSRIALIATFTLSLAGLALASLAFTTDPTIRSTPATWHGQLHDLAFVLLGITLMPAMILLGFAFRQSTHWRSLASYTWGTALLAIPTFSLKGAVFYVFLLAVLVWSKVISFRLMHQVNEYIAASRN